MVSCGECAALAADLRAIAAASRALGSAFNGQVAPAPRDFRITELDAARLGRRTISGFGRPRGARSWTRGLGGALATLGLVGLLVSAAPMGFLGAAAGTGTGERADPGFNAVSPGPRQPGPAASELQVKSLESLEFDATAGQLDDPVVPGGNGAFAIVSAGALVAGIALLLTSRNGRRAGP